MGDSQGTEQETLECTGDNLNRKVNGFCKIAFEQRLATGKHPLSVQLHYEYVFATYKFSYSTYQGINSVEHTFRPNQFGLS